MTTLVVVAKECRPGKVKTRLSPRLRPEQCALVAQASLDDTLDIVRSVPAERVLYLAGRAPATSVGLQVIPQCEGPLDVRLAHLLDLLAGPMVLIGMDTPQVDAALLTTLCTAWPGEVDAFFGPAADGGFWLLGMREPDGAVVRGVAMSRDTTGARVRSRLTEAGLSVVDVPTLADVDTVAVASEVAALVPGGRFAAALGAALSQSALVAPSRVPERASGAPSAAPSTAPSARAS